MRKRKLGETFFLYYYCNDVLIEQDAFKGLSHLSECLDLGNICLFKCPLLKTNPNTSLFYLVSLMILFYECYKSLTVNKLLELYTMDNYGLFFLCCILLLNLQLNSLYAF